MSSSSCVPGERSCLKANLGLFGGCDQDVISGKRKFKYFQRTASWNPGPLQLFPTTWCWAGREVWCVILAMPSKSPNREGVCGGAIYMCEHMHMCAPFSSLPLWNTMRISREGGGGSQLEPRRTISASNANFLTSSWQRTMPRLFLIISLCSDRIFVSVFLLEH